MVSLHEVAEVIVQANSTAHHVLAAPWLYREIKGLAGRGFDSSATVVVGAGVYVGVGTGV